MLKREPSESSPGGQSLIKKALDINQSLLKSKYHLFWGLINSAALGILLYSLLQNSKNETLKALVVYYSMLILITLLSTQALFHFIKYSVIKLTLTPVVVTPIQKKLLGVGRSDRWFVTADKSPGISPSAHDHSPERTFTATTPMNLSSSSWLSPAVQNESAISNSSYSMRSNAWANYQNSYGRPTVLFSRSCDEDIIRDELSLSKYLDEAEELERRAASTANIDNSGNVLSTFWNSSGQRAGLDVSQLLGRCSYQIAPASPVQATSSPVAGQEESLHPSPTSSLNNTELWRRVKVDPSSITQWNANLRMWTSLTILERLVKELDFIDEAFMRCGMSDLHLGSVGLDRLKKTASIPQVAASVPSLPRLVPFLELSPHQEYLVNRIRELAKGGSMSEFRWNGGGCLNGKNWEEHLPTDAALVMHLIATYLDLQLLPPPHRPDTRPFSSQYLFRSPEKPPRTGVSPVIYQTQLNPPHFVIVDKDEVYDVPKGRNNVLYAFLLFLHILKTREHGMLGPVNLGRSGVNVLWVIDP